MAQYQIKTQDPYSGRDGQITYYDLNALSAAYSGYYFPPPYISWNFYVQAPDTGPDSDSLIGDDGQADRLFGSVGDDTLSGLKGDDRLVGGDGNDYLQGGDDGDLLYGDYVNTHVVMVDSGGTEQWIVPDEPDESIVGDDILDGGDGADTLDGGPGNDQLHGGPRGDGFTDVLTGGPGADGFFLTYDPSSDPGQGTPGFVSYWTTWAENFVVGKANSEVKAGILKLGKLAAKDFFDTAVGSTILGGVATAVGNEVEKGLKLLLGMDMSAAPKPTPTGEDVLVITDFDPREDVVILPVPTANGKSLTAVVTNFGSTGSPYAQNGGTGWGVTFTVGAGASAITYGELLISPAFLQEFGLNPNSPGVTSFIQQLFASVVDIDDQSSGNTGGLVNPEQQYPFPSSPSDYVDGQLPTVADTPVPFQAPEGTYTRVYGAYGPQMVVAPPTNTTTTLVAGSNMGDVIFLGENGFSPDFWDNARVIAQSPGASHILGFDGDDIINGAAGQDLIHGGDGDDLIYGWNAASPPNVDQLYGDDGDDTIFVAKPAGGRAAADMDGGDGNDTASFYFSRYGVTANLSTQSGSNSGDSGLSYQIFDIENLIGTDYDDTLTGDGGDNLLQGHVGNDTLIAGDGNDILEGGPLPPALYRVDAGGPTLRTSDGGPDWGRDVTASPSVYLVTSGTTTAASTANVLYDPADFEGAPNSLFTAFRTGTASSFNSMAWSLPVFASGTYTVNLFLAEGDFSIDKAGQRVFDVTVEGTTPDEFQDIDPWLLGGSGNNGAGNNAFVLSYDIDVTDTSLDLSFVPDAGLPTIFGIEIVRITSDDDILDGGDGNDTAVYNANSGKVAIDLTAGTANEYGSDAGTKADKVVSSDTLTGIENIDGSAYDDTIIGDENDNVLAGGAGDNTLQGGGGSDTWSTAGGGKAFYIDMTTWATAGQPLQQANSYGGTDTIFGFQNVIAGEGDDTIIGDSRDNVLTGRGGDDAITGGDGFDTVAFADGDQGVVIGLWAETNGLRTGQWLDAFGGSDTIDRTTIEAYRGTSAADNMTGDGVGREAPMTKAIFFGEGGDDALTGSGLADQLDGGDGDDKLSGLGGDDMLSGGDGDDVIYGGVVSLTLQQINVGGGELKPAGGTEWKSDDTTDPSIYLTNPGDIEYVNTTSTVFYEQSAVDGAPEDLFSQGRQGEMSWEIPVYGNTDNNPGANGTGEYRVGLYFVEYDKDITSPNARVFDVTIEGTKPASMQNIDPWVEGGDDNGGKGPGAFELSEIVTVSDGLVNIDFVQMTGGPILQGLKVEQITTDNDTIDGGAGDDVILPGPGTDTVAGGDGLDTVVYVDNAGKMAIDLAAGTAEQYDAEGALAYTDSLTDVEGAVGSAVADNLTGDSNDNVLTGYLGDDVIDGGDGNDTADYSQRTTGIDAEISAKDADGNQTVSLRGGDYAPIVETDTLSSIETVNGSGQDDRISGSSGNDIIGGDEGNDVLTGKGGADILQGGDGDDTLYGGTNGFVARYNAHGAAIPALDDGPDWAIDTDLWTGEVSTSSNPSAKILYDRIDLTSVPGEIYGTERWGQPENGGQGQTLPGRMIAEIPASKGYYDLFLYVVEGVEGTPPPPPPRVFNIAVEGTVPEAFSNINPYEMGGENNQGKGHEALVLSSGDFLVTDGSVTANFGWISLNGEGNPNANALALRGYNTAADGDDKLIGGDGNDMLFGYDGNDVLDGGDGDDTASYLHNKGKVVVDLSSAQAQEYGAAGGSDANTVLFVDNLTNIEKVVGSLFDDSLTGDENANVLQGSAGADSLRGNGGMDTFVGSGLEVAGDVVEDLEDGERIEISNYFGQVILRADSFGGARVLLDADGDGVSEGSMLVRGDFSEREMDRLRVESTSEGQNFHITLRQAYSSDQIIDGGGGTGDDDFIYGSADNDRLNGRGGDDVVDGNSGDDDLFGGSGDDILRGEEGDDAIWAGSGDDIASGGLGNDVIRAGSGDDTVQGGEGNDRLYGGSGDDILVTGAGDKNVATGGCGADIFVFGSELANGRQERHRLTDFETGVDAIDLGGFEIEQIHSRSDSVVLWVGPDLDRIAVEGVTEISLIDFVEDTLL